MLTIYAPDYCKNEIQYIIDVIFNTFWSVDYHLEYHSCSEFVIRNADHKSIHSPDVFFQKAYNHWLKLESMPILPLNNLDLRDLSIKTKALNPLLPILFGSGGFENDKNRIFLPVDVFGSAFFMLSRYEEIVAQDRDLFGRFPYEKSIAYMADLVERPIINEYIELLWQSLKDLWPNLIRKNRKFQTLLSCDVDVPYKCTVKSIRKQILELGADIILRRNPLLAWRNLKNFFSIRKGELRWDVNNTFDWIISECDQFDIQCVFNFIALDTVESNYDGCYSISEPVIKNLLKKIHTKQHSIGLHPSFYSSLSEEVIKDEFCRLLETCKILGIEQTLWSSRQHYLKIKIPDTWRYLENAGISCDTSLTFSEVAGFRCGICYEYPLYDVINRKSLNLLERPLIVMDGSLFFSSYMGLDFDKAKQYVLKLKSLCMYYNGDFTLLWHNDTLSSTEQRKFLRTILQRDRVCE